MAANSWKHNKSVKQNFFFTLRFKNTAKLLTAAVERLVLNDQVKLSCPKNPSV